MLSSISRRRFLWGGSVSLLAACRSDPRSSLPAHAEAFERAWSFILACRQPDGGYAPSPDAAYPGNSDTRASDLAAVTYAATLAKSLGRELPEPAASVRYVRSRQRPDGSFANVAGEFNPDDSLALLYNTTQGVVCLRALGTTPEYDPLPVMSRWFQNDEFRQLPLYTTSFFPLFYAALDQPFPVAYRAALLDYMTSQQAEDGYLQDHVAATFHMAHFCRLVGLPTPRAEAMVARTLRDQTPAGGWDIKEPDWDVHACFDALFILRQLGGGSAECRRALSRAAEWVLTCQNPDGGFGHFPGWHSDMDAVYFQLGSLIQAEVIPGARYDLPDAHTLSWGHAMDPERAYA